MATFVLTPITTDTTSPPSIGDLTPAASSSSAASNVVPAVCYSTCNNVYIEVLKTGKTPALCESRSSFELGYSSCLACIEASGKDLNTAVVDISPQFGPFLDFCASQQVPSSEDSGTVESTANDQSITSLPSSLSYITTTFSSPISSPLESGYTTITELNTEAVSLFNGSIITFTLSNIITLRDKPTSFPLATSPQSETSFRHVSLLAVILGTVFGSLAIITFSCWACWKFWRRPRSKKSEIGGSVVGQGKSHEKAQLHSDSLPPKTPQELDGSPKGPVAELQAVEPVGAELSERINSLERG